MKPSATIRACIFDAYGTLFDFGSAVKRCGALPDDLRKDLTSLWREKQVQYTWLRTIQGRYVDFWSVTEDALDFALDSLNLTDQTLRKQLMSSYLSLEPFPEVAEVLVSLRRAGFKTAILSNGSPHMLDSIVSAAGLTELFDSVLSADAVKLYKTHPRVYQHALDSLGVRAAEVSFQSSNAWDAHGAADFGMQVVWCNRYGQRAERLPGSPRHEIRTLAELPALLLAD